MTDVVVECFAEVVRTRCWCSISILFVHGGCFASGFDWVSTNVTDFDRVGNDLLHFVKDIGDIAKTCAFLKVFGGDGHVLGNCGANSMRGAEFGCRGCDG